MKRTIKYLFAACLTALAVGCVTACNDPPDGSSQTQADLPKLSMPQTARADFWELTWASVENAAGYTVKLLDKEYTVENTSFSLFEYLDADKEYSLAVKALGDGIAYSDSEWRPITYKTEAVTDGLEYTLLEDGTYEVSCPEDSIPKNGELVLPDYYEKKPVTVFAPNGYAPSTDSETQYADVTKIRLSKKLKKIEDRALQGASVTEVYFPSSLRTVGGFSACKQLTSVTLPDGVETVGYNAFNGCEALSELHLPNSITTIDFNAFANCIGLRNVDLPDALISLAGFFGCTSLTSIDIPESVVELGKNAFMRCPLSTIQLPENLTSIGISAFNNTSLSEIEFPLSLSHVGVSAFDGTPWYEKQTDGLVYCGNILYGYKGNMPADTVLDNLPATMTGISDGAFLNCEALVGITLPDGITVIGESTFSGCSNLQTVTLPKALCVINDLAFQNCESLTQIEFSSTLKKIGSRAFEGNGLTSVIIPEGVTTIGSGAFMNCKSLTAVALPSTLEYWEGSIFGGTFSGCENLMTVTLAEGIKEIPRSAFEGCVSLTKLDIPQSVTTLSLDAFNGTGLPSIFNLPKYITTFESKVSGQCPITGITIPRTLECLDYNLFYQSKINVFYFMGTKDQYNALNIIQECSIPPGLFTKPFIEQEKAALAAWIEALTVYYYSETPPSDGNYWHYDADGNVAVW